MAKKVSVVNMKGGVGKSTLAVQLSFCFAASSEFASRVLLVDLDPQFNSTQYLLGVQRVKEIVDKNIPTIWHLFEQFTHTPGRKEPKPIDPKAFLYKAKDYSGGRGIDLIPSRLELAYSLQNPAGKERLLQKVISKIEEEYKLIIIDCPPTESVFTTAAYLSSDFILVPVKPEYLSTIGLPLLTRSMKEFKDQYEDHDLNLAGIVFNATQQYAPEEITSKNEVKKIAEERRWYVFKEEISYSRSYPKSAREGRPISSTSYARSAPALKFEAFAKEFAERIGL